MSGTNEGCESNHDHNRISNVTSNEGKTSIEMSEDKTPLNSNDNDNITVKDKKKAEKARTSATGAGTPIKDLLTNVAHCCILTYALFIGYLCLTHPFVFFTWHPLLLSLGWTFLMMESILTLSKENPIPRRLKLNHTLRVRFHWIPLTVAAVVIAIGFLVITINKNRLNKSHYTSWHGLCGLIGLIAYILPSINGIALLYKKELKDYFNPKLVKLVHVAAGVVSLVFGGISLILSVYTKWFRKNTNGNVYLFYFSIIIVSFSVIWVVQRPLIKCVKNIYKLITENKEK